MFSLIFLLWGKGKADYKVGFTPFSCFSKRIECVVSSSIFYCIFYGVVFSEKRANLFLSFIFYVLSLVTSN